MAGLLIVIVPLRGFPLSATISDEEEEEERAGCRPQGHYGHSHLHSPTFSPPFRHAAGPLVSSTKVPSAVWHLQSIEAVEARGTTAELFDCP